MTHETHLTHCTGGGHFSGPIIASQTAYSTVEEVFPHLESQLVVTHCTLYPPLHIQAKFLQGHSFTHYAIEMVTVEFLLQVGGLYPTEGIHDCTEEIVKVRYITVVNHW